MKAHGPPDDGPSACPDRDELAAFSLGKLDEEALQSVGKHIEACQRCEDTLLDLDDGSDTMISQLRDVGKAPAYHETPEYREFERRIGSIRP